MILKCLMCLLVASFILNSSSAANLATLNPANLKKLFDSVKPYADLTNGFYSVKGLQLLGESLSAPQDVCNLAKTKVDKNNLESIYYATSLAALVPNCAVIINY